jgi:hypothetical protein
MCVNRPPRSELKLTLSRSAEDVESEISQLRQEIEAKAGEVCFSVKFCFFRSGAQHMARRCSL